MQDIQNHSLLQHNTFHIDESCSRFIEFDTVDEARNALQLAHSGPHPLLIIGSGSNLLLTQHFAGTVLHSNIQGIERVGETSRQVFIRCGSGVDWDSFVAYTVDNHYYGLENLSFIPGTVGASAVQNIGAYGVEVCNSIYKIEALNMQSGELQTIDPHTCNYAYRYSKFKDVWKGNYLITHVTYALSKEPQLHLDYGNVRTRLEQQGMGAPTLQQVRQTIIDIRKEKLPDPEELGNAGSFFMNPMVSQQQFAELQNLYPAIPHYPAPDNQIKIPAAWLIEQCGWKGKCSGAAGVHNKQPLVLVNLGGATGNEVLQLCHTVQKDVEQKFGIFLKPEVNIL